jgi:hypothetical protein
MQHHLEWNGRNWILILDNGPHGTIEMTLDDFVALATDLKTGLLLRYDGEDDLPLDQCEEE